MKGFKLAAAAATAILIAACGGGGGGGGEETPAGSPTGFWNGNTSTGLIASVAVFPDGTAWAAYLGPGTLGFVQGSINGPAVDFNITGNTITAANVSTTAQTKQSINSVVSAGGQSVTFAGTYDASFEETPSLAAVAGTFAGEGPANGTTVTVAADGSITGTDGACNFTGTATPRTDGNAFNVTITFGGGGCALGTSTATGVAVYDSVDRALLAAAVTPARDGGAIFLGSKP